MAEAFQTISRPDLQRALAKLAKTSGGAWGARTPDNSRMVSTSEGGNFSRAEQFRRAQEGLDPSFGGGPPIVSGGVALDDEGLSPGEVQQLATYLYTLGENVNFLHENGTGTGGDPDPDPGGGDEPSPPGDIDPALLRDLSNSTLFPFTYALLYENRNEFSARTSGGGVWLAQAEGTTQPLVREEAHDFSIPV